MPAFFLRGLFVLVFVVLVMTLIVAPALAQEIEPTSFIVEWKKSTPQELQQKVDQRKGNTAIANFIQDITLYRGQERPETLLSELQKLDQSSQIEKREALVNKNFALVRVKSPEELQQVMAKYQKQNNLVQLVQPNYRYHATLVPTDTWYQSNQWNLKKIQMENAWDITQGNSQIKIAVLDTGINDQHEEFTRAIADRSIIRAGCFASGDVVPKPLCAGAGGVYADQCTSSEQTFDDNITACGGGHGSQMTGIIKATLNDQKLAGIAPNISIIIIKVLNLYGEGASSSIADGIAKAIQQGANIISMSLSGDVDPTQDAVLAAQIQEAIRHNISVFAAAGNDNADANTQYPASDPNVITVAATSPTDARASYSNFGSSLDVSAPGGDLESERCTFQSCITAPGANCSNGNAACYRLGMGTSQATPHAAAVAALLLSKKADLTPQQIKTILTSNNNTDPVTSETNKTIPRRLNAFKALQDPLVGGTALAATPTPSPTGQAAATPTPTGTGGAPTPTINLTPAIATTYLSGKVTNLAPNVSLAGLIIEITSVNKDNQAVTIVGQPVTLQSDGLFLLSFTTNPSLAGQKVSVKLTIKDTSGHGVGTSPTFNDIAIGQEVGGLNFSIYTCPTKASGDASCDGVVNRNDFLIWHTEYQDSQISPLLIGRADFNADGVVDLRDYLVFIGKNL